MLDSPFTIYNASAGSGKTYTLTKSYLKILIESENPQEFKHILAITFTNKAVGEMKDRIISMLKSFSSISNEDEVHPMVTELCKDTSKSLDEIRSKSLLILKNILHNYGAFEISTIDAFTHRLIRTFAHDLRLPLNFEVELDQEKLLNEAVDKLISKAGLDKALTKTLVKFAIEKTNEDKSWDISYDFKKISGFLLKENDLSHLQKVKDKTLEDFEIIKKTLAQELETAENSLKSSAAKTLTLIEESGLTHEDFTSKYLPNYFAKILSGSLNINYGANWQVNLLEGKPLYPKRVSKVTASVIDDIQPTLAEAFKKSKKYLYQIKFLKSVLQNLTPFSVLNLIGKELNALKTDKNLMLISEFNTIISQEIKNQPTPFIYERIGERFNHFFIDEFQDTSQLQWQNLIPLLDNTFSSGKGTSMIVGDAKQAIYRWRGSLPEQFISLYNGDDLPFHLSPHILSLDTNYRSFSQIIAFNNSFFKYLGESFFENENYIRLYENSSQKTHKNSQGLVTLKFLEINKDDNRDEEYIRETTSTVKNCLDNGYNYRDICIITRKRKEGVALAEALSEYKLPITSSETLLLKKSPKIQFLNAILKLLLSPSNNKLKIQVLEFLAEKNGVEDKHQYYSKQLRKDFDTFIKDLCDSPNYIDTIKLVELPLYDLVEELIRMFELNDGSDAYLQFYLDEVLTFVQSQHSDIAGFVSFFEEREEKLSIVVSDDVNAIRIMTIHKSKGLEFPVVIFPFADLDIYRELSPKIWFPVDKSNYNGFEYFLINYNKDVEFYREPGKSLHQRHRHQIALDNINLLYVVMTRAVEQLHIISKYDISPKKMINNNSFSGLFISYLKSQDLWLNTKNYYIFGEQANVESVISNIKTEQMDFISNSRKDSNFKIITKASLLWNTEKQKAVERGNLVHLILSKIRTNTDIDFAFSELISSGELNNENTGILRPLVERVIYHPELESYYTNEASIFNEQDILLPSGLSIRPDRININEINQATLIDYKTGVKKNSHKIQITDYGSVIEAMGFEVIKKLIVYLNESIEIIEV